MSIVTLILASLVALEFFYILYLETIATTSAATARVFGMSQEELEQQSVELVLTSSMRKLISFPIRSSKSQLAMKKRN